MINRHLRNPHNRREMSGADGKGSAGESGCGAEITLYVRFAGETILEAVFTASGSSAIIAAGSVLTEMLEGTHWKLSAAIPASAIHVSLAGKGVSEDSRQRSASRGSAGSPLQPGSLAQACEFAIEALHGALTDALRRGTFPRAEAVEHDSVIVAMSGGVDSSTACLLEQEEGKQVTGVTMRLWDSEENAQNSCCSPQSIRDARQVSHGLGIPHLTVDYRDAFRKKVVADFVAEYLAGRTPNPCTVCNGGFRFPALVELAQRLGAVRVATGHYVRVVEREGRSFLARGLDEAKDQSYMLWGIASELLTWLEFPLGDMEKHETRKLARLAGLSVCDRADSQDVCFISGDDYRRFITGCVTEAGGSLPGKGEIVDMDGRRLGSHAGYLNYTVGQRRGLGISSPEPLYVVRTDPAANTVVVGAREDLAVNSLILEGVNAFLPMEDLEAERSLMAQVRYNSTAIRCRVQRVGDGSGLRVDLAEPAYGVAAGQSAVLYMDDLVAAGGKIV